MEASLSVISGKWKMTILQKLLAGPIRYSDIKHNMPDITEKCSPNSSASWKKTAL